MLAAGRLEEASERDTLLVGSQTNLLAYDVENNSDVYFKVNDDGDEWLEAEKASDFCPGRRPASRFKLAMSFVSATQLQANAASLRHRFHATYHNVIRMLPTA